MANTPRGRAKNISGEGKALTRQSEVKGSAPVGKRPEGSLKSVIRSISKLKSK